MMGWFFLFILLASSPARAQTTDPALVPPNPSLDNRPPTGASGTQNLVPPPPGGVPAEGPGVPSSKDASKVEGGRTILQGIFEDYRYEPEGKRDPFMPYNSPKQAQDCGPFEECDTNDLERFDLDQLKLVGIIWDVKTPKAMFTDPSGKTHVVGEQNKVGRNNGYVAEIREGELIVIEKFYNLGRFTYQTRVLKLQRE